MGIFTRKNPQKLPSTKSRQVDTFIASSVTIEGRVDGKENVTIDGTFLGIIKIAGDLHIFEQAYVEGEVEASKIIIEGKIKGRITATEKIELTKTACVKADIKTKIIAVEAGAVLEGRCEAGEVKKVEEQVEKKDVEKENEKVELD